MQSRLPRLCCLSCCCCLPCQLCQLHPAAHAEAFLRVDTPATTLDSLTNALNLPRQLILLRSLLQAFGCAPPTAVTKTASLTGKVFVLQIAEEYIGSLYEDGFSSGPAAKLWETYQALKPVLTLFALPSDAAAFECAARLQHKGMTMLWLRADDGVALAAALAADPTKELRLMSLPGATVSQMPPEQAGQPMEYSSMGPVSSSSGSSGSSSTAAVAAAAAVMAAAAAGMCI
jgi:hypothetical protein